MANKILMKNGLILTFLNSLLLEDGYKIIAEDGELFDLEGNDKTSGRVMIKNIPTYLGFGEIYALMDDAIVLSRTLSDTDIKNIMAKNA